jgi:hypothetical protein
LFQPGAGMERFKAMGGNEIMGEDNAQAWMEKFAAEQVPRPTTLCPLFTLSALFVLSLPSIYPFCPQFTLYIFFYFFFRLYLLCSAFELSFHF